MCRCDLDWYEFFCTLAGNLACNVGKFLDIIIPSTEDVLRLGHQPFERFVWCVGQTVTGQDLEELVVEVARNCFYKGQSSSDWVGHSPQAVVQVVEDEVQCVLDFVELGGGEKFIEREVFH